VLSVNLSLCEFFPSITPFRSQKVLEIEPLMPQCSKAKKEHPRVL
jgi:hypothetical protein